ncbi:GNAT family N-acetyltransferase [Micromonospora polyrhachis]|uniref:ElaA protein n=1 Tax=Micromonospora polyrhachis TaxID=1282883 RepID=A0A7W7WNI2_9ACTN|nr:GNAT family N-acetyltransferase [Micromonospora polyrhachis]MBB4957243.1 ElaA protein [Micromonospora polyrhachis]
MPSQPAQFHVAHFADLDTRTWHDLLRLRIDVFVVEQKCPYPELDGRDVEPGTQHLWLSQDRDSVPVACLRLLTDPGGIRRIGRVAVAKAARGHRHADRLMTEALALVGADPCVLDAQSYLVAFYQRHGFAVTGPEYVEDGIPHLPMRRDPQPGLPNTSSPTSPTSLTSPGPLPNAPQTSSGTCLSG